MLIAAPALLTLILAIACTKDGAQEGAVDPQKAANTSSVASSQIAPPSGGVEVDAGLGCGCKLCAPVVSNDSCDKDDDCVPESGCHAHACVAKANAKPTDPKLNCTMVLDCHSADANKCGCVNHKCALGVAR